MVNINFTLTHDDILAPQEAQRCTEPSHMVTSNTEVKSYVRGFFRADGSGLDNSVVTFDSENSDIR